MSVAVLSEIKKGMKALGINYDYMQWRGEPVYPYWVGEYQEIEPLNEDGMQETAFTLTGFSRRTFLDLEKDKEKIREYFNSVTGRRVAAGGSVVAIFYVNALGNIPTGDPELKKIQVNLTVKEWKVI